MHSFNWPDRFVIGTVGEPGSRTFYAQARTGRQVISVAMEKQQAAALAQGMDTLLDEVMSEEGNPASVPAATPEGLQDDGPLEQPLLEQFRTGSMTLSWDPSKAQVVFQAEPLIVVDEDDADVVDLDAEPAEVFVVRIPVGSARAFAERARAVVGAGRPLCPICEEPMDPDGHTCAVTP